MTIVFKFLWKSLNEKKARTFLVFFSIAASASLIFANEGFKRTVEYMFYEADTRHAGNSDLLINVKSEVGAKEWIDTELLKVYQDEFIYANSFQKQYALYAQNIEDMYYYQIYGVNMEQFQEHNPFELKEGEYGDWTGYKVVMGDAYAKKYDFLVGDTMTLELNGGTYDFTVVGIAKQEGIYLRELADGGTLFAPKETIEAIFGGKTNQVYIKVKNPLKLTDIYEQLTQTFSEYQVYYTIDDKLIKAETSNYVLPFRIASMAVVFMSMFIIFTGFGLITNERISSLGTLRSLGLTRKKLNHILLLESAGIGALGGFAGCVLGLGVLSFIKNTYFKNNGTFSNSAPLLFGIKEIMIAVLTAVLITSASAFLSIRKTTKLQIKEIILHRSEQKVTKKSKLWVIGLLFFISCIVIPPYLPITLFSMILSCSLATGVLIGLVLFIPGLVKLLAEAAAKLGLSEEVYLGIRNVKDNKALSSNLKLFSAMIAIVAYMVSIFNTMSYDLDKAWKYNNLYEVSVTLRESDEDSLERVKAVEGVTDAVGYYVNYECELSEDGVFLNMFYGIEDKSFFDMNVVGGLNEVQGALDSLNDGNNIITTNILKAKLGLKLGDVLRIKSQGKEADFTVTGFVETNLGIGHVGYISGDNFKKFIGTTNYDCFQVKGNVDQDTLKLNLKREFTKDILLIETKRELEQANADKVDSIFKSINIYTYFAVGVGMLGMLNNIMAGFMQRKRSLALYRCIGMSKKGINKMLLTEAITIGLLGSLLGLCASIIMMRTIPQVVGLMWGNVAAQPATTAITVLSISGFFAMLMVSLLPLRHSGKISIMDHMKYE